MKWSRIIPVLACGIALLLGRNAFGMDGRVTTLDGQTFRGQLRLLSNTVRIVNVARTQLIQVGLSNLHSIQLFSGPIGPVAHQPRSDEFADEPRWKGADIGPARLLGNATFHKGRIKLQANTLEPTGGSDSLHFAFHPLTGNGEIVGRLLRSPKFRRPAEVGLMIRESLEPNAPSFFIGQSPSSGLTQWRLAENRTKQVNRHRLVHSWLRLKRHGEWLSAYSSRNGLRWRLVDKVQLPMKRNILVGCTLAGMAPQDTMNVCRFDNVRSGQGLRQHGFIPQTRLESGSLLIEEIAYLRDGSLHFAGILPLPDVPLRHATRVDFQWLPSRWKSKVRDGRRGALLTSGEFFEGRLKSLGEGNCTMSTVLFGLRQFDAHQEIVSIVMGQPDPPQKRDELHMWSGSILRGRIERLDESGVVFFEPLLGRMVIPFFALKEISIMNAAQSKRTQDSSSWVVNEVPSTIRTRF